MAGGGSAPAPRVSVEASMTDDEAIRRCQDGDRDAFRHLVEAYKHPLYGTAVLMTGNPALAEEHVQEALLNAWRGIGRFERGRPFKPWLMRILVNDVLSGRRRRALRTVPIEDSPEPRSTGDEAEAIANRETLRQVLEQLTPEHREVVVLRYFADLTVAEVARSAGIREGTAKSRLHRALRQMRDLLEPPSAMEVAGNDA